MPGKIQVGLHFGETMVGRHHIDRPCRFAVPRRIGQERLLRAPQSHASAFVRRQQLGDQVRAVHVQPRCTTQSAKQHGHAGAIAQQHIRGRQRLVVVIVPGDQVHRMGIDEPKYRHRLRPGQSLDQALLLIGVRHDLERLNDRLPVVLPGQYAHQESSRLERTHSTWRLIRKPRYRGIFFSA
ncbi:hypothetical protein D3C79_869660 [compost metagenome]